MDRWMKEIGGSPGRSGHRLSIDSARVVFEARESLAGLLGADSSKQIIFTCNATMALNLAISGAVKFGDRVVTTSMEHNSVMRPLRHLAREKVIELDTIPCAADGSLDPGDLIKALERETVLVAVTHASNVTGTISPIGELARICRDRGSLLLVDAAQTAGAVPMDVQSDGIDMLAFTGHKSLYGPTGTGGLYVREGLKIKPLVRGGTGSNSEREEHPEFFPDCLEAGTPNAVGLAGLKAGLDFIQSTGIDQIRDDELSLTVRLLEGLVEIPGVRIFGTMEKERRTPAVSFTLEGLSPSEVGYILDEAFGILVRVGLHCSPSAHRTIGTFPEGTVRIVPGFFNSPEDIDYSLECIRTIARRGSGT
jgi:cysteine desulfurase family protein